MRRGPYLAPGPGFADRWVTQWPLHIPRYVQLSQEDKTVVDILIMNTCDESDLNLYKLHVSLNGRQLINTNKK